LQNLDDNVASVQVASFLFLVVLLSEFLGFFVWRGVTDSTFSGLPFFGGNYNQLASVFIFSWAYTMCAAWGSLCFVSKIRIARVVMHARGIGLA
jgi:hypothetical protein